MPYHDGTRVKYGTDDRNRFCRPGSLAALFGMAFLVAAAFLTAAPRPAFAVNYKKDYCGGEDYVGNAGSKYPHLHCGKDFLTLSRSGSDHINFNGRPNCNKVNEVLDDVAGNYGSASDKAAITNALTAYKNAGCP